ncbi:hypothetical protein P3T27_002147 [Kitasatospora sp. MAA19]|uniref:hypothetical protein n=1 Tax=Kitasatospora sp. MAA19 TaxID=3035090 RepID=UPI002474D5AB|nr:hypothetical protein [Kitasatospora sp. MAA19]MDH6705437.1 hypothetical protein [Kitasatospora sp. MAA19]
MTTEVVEIALSGAIQEYTRQNYTYGPGNFEHTAEENGWTSIGMICDLMGSPVSCKADSRHYQYVTSTWALHASNAEEIERILDEVADGLEWAHGPGDSYVFNADRPEMVQAVADIEAALGDGALNETRKYELEYEENHPSEHECYSEDPDCRCEANTHSCREQLWGGVEGGEIGLTADCYWCQYCNGWVDMTDADRMEMHRRLYGRREWWQYTRADFSPEAASRHAAAVARYRRGIRAWRVAGQLDLFSSELPPTTDELIALMGLEN